MAGKQRKAATPQYELVKIADLQPYDNNPRVHTAAQVQLLEASIEEFGWTNPVLIGPNNEVLGGHGRIEAAERKGLIEVECKRLAHLTPDQMRAYRLTDNRIAELGEWDHGKLVDEIEALQELDFDIDLTGFNSDTLGALLPSDDFQGTEDEQGRA